MKRSNKYTKYIQTALQFCIIAQKETEYIEIFLL